MTEKSERETSLPLELQMTAKKSTPSYKQIKMILKQFVAEEELQRAIICLRATSLFLWSRVNYKVDRDTQIADIEGRSPLATLFWGVMENGLYIMMKA